MKKAFNYILFLLILFSCNGRRENVLLYDDYSGLHRGPLGSGQGARTEYHYLPDAAPKGNWSVSTFRYNLPESWYVREVNSRRALVQKAVNKDTHWHPMVIAGNKHWRNYSFQTGFTPDSTGYLCGVVFRYRNDRCYYFFGVENDSAVLKMVKHGTDFRTAFEKVLASEKFDYQAGQRIEASIELQGKNIRAAIGGGPAFEVSDTTYGTGKIGFLADGPAAFGPVKVIAGRREKQWLEQVVTEEENLEKELQRINPKPVVWKKINTEGFGTARNLRFGDLNNDGTVDVLIGQVVHHGPKDRNSELSCLTAMTFDRGTLWQTGQADPWKDHLTNDVAFQIHDIDRDGRNDVIYCMNREIIVADGATGKIKYKAPTPLLYPENPDKNSVPSAVVSDQSSARTPGDCIFFCDLKGKGYDADIILKNRYTHLWAMDSKLKIMWEGECRTGHYPYAMDIDNDRRDELMMGYTLFDHDGRILWTLDSVLNDHADGVALVKLRDDQEIRLICAASDEGMLFTDLHGNILRHHFIGHVQNPAVANFRDDLPGLETVSINFWGNQGIIHLFDADGNISMDLEPNQYGSMCLPLNWTGKPEEFFVLNANVDEGGAYDGHGHRVLAFPDDGHPDMCYAVLDITGDCRDEIVVWDPHEIWVYTQDDNPVQGDLYRPVRNPLYNYSNYQATVSLPEWGKNDVYLFSYFTGNGEDGLHLAYSTDGLFWEALGEGRSFLIPEVGKDKLMRDPCIIRGHDGLFHMVWTTGWWDRHIGYASSPDLVRWSEQKAIPVMEHEPEAKNCWAPEIFYDREKKEYLIFWSTTIPGRHSEVATSEREKGLNHRIYYITTSDFKKFSETKIFFNPVFSAIDATITEKEKTFYMVVKNENSSPPEKNLRVTSSSFARGPYRVEVSAPITGDYWAEGPTCMQVGEYVYVYFDKYRDHRYGAVRSQDMEHWEDVSDQVSFPPGLRHGTAFKASANTLKNLKNYKEDNQDQ